MPDLPTDDADAGVFLLELGLTAAEVDDLRTQGFVAAEYRTHQGARLGPYFKLRWRMQGRQRVLYMGADVDHAERVANALARWQQAQVLARQMTPLIAGARKNLKRAKKALAGALADQGRLHQPAAPR